MRDLSAAARRAAAGGACGLHLGLGAMVLALAHATRRGLGTHYAAAARQAVCDLPVPSPFRAIPRDTIVGAAGLVLATTALDPEPALDLWRRDALSGLAASPILASALPETTFTSRDVWLLPGVAAALRLAAARMGHHGNLALQGGEAACGEAGALLGRVATGPVEAQAWHDALAGLVAREASSARLLAGAEIALAAQARTGDAHWGRLAERAGAELIARWRGGDRPFDTRAARAHQLSALSGAPALALLALRLAGRHQISLPLAALG